MQISTFRMQTPAHIPPLFAHTFTIALCSRMCLACSTLTQKGKNTLKSLEDSGCTVDMIANRNLVPVGFELNLDLGSLAIE